MSERFQTQIMLCWPSDRADIARLNADIDNPRHRFSPSVEHSLSTCDSCQRGIWIGNQQLQLVKSPFVSAKKLCLFCAGHVTKALNLTPHEVDLARFSEPARRRTA